MSRGWTAAELMGWLLAVASGSGTDRLWIRHGRCSECRRSHALFPDFLLERRLDHVEVIGHALVLGVVIGLGMRRVADQVGVPMTTARDWQRRFRIRASALMSAIVAVAVHLDPAPVLLEGDAETAAIQPLGAAWQRAHADALVSACNACGGSGA